MVSSHASNRMGNLRCGKNSLSKPNSSITEAIPQTIVVERRGVENTAVVPDSCHRVSSELLLGAAHEGDEPISFLFCHFRRTWRSWFL